jgi:hypothetical protein
MNWGGGGSRRMEYSYDQRFEEFGVIQAEGASDSP